MAKIYGGVTKTQGRPLLNFSERTPNQNDLMRRNNDYLSQQIRVSMPAEVVSFDAEKQTITAQPLVREKVIDRSTGAIQWYTLPVLQDIPVVYPGGGGVCLTFPLQAGDEVLLVFADSCIDSWWESGSIQNWNDRRRHDLSDAFALPGPASLPNAIPAIQPIGAELRTRDGLVRLNVSEAGVYIIIGETTLSLVDENTWTLGIGDNKIVIDETALDLQGTIKINGDLYTAHTHSGVQSGGSTTGPVVP